MLLGSEGILGVITEAWVRVQDAADVPSRRPASRFRRFAAGAEAVRALSQSGLYPSNCRLLDPGEAALTGAAGDGGAPAGARLRVRRPPGRRLDGARARVCARPRRRRLRERSGRRRAARRRPVGAWRERLPARALPARRVRRGWASSCETFETAITWDRFAELPRGGARRRRAAVRDVCGAGRVTCRFTHVYPDGPAPYFTVLAPARRGSELEQWDEIKAAASEAVLAAGGTITHHHAVGRDHRPWYDRQRPDPFARGARRRRRRPSTPAAILNPGVLIDPVR